MRVRRWHALVSWAFLLGGCAFDPSGTTRSTPGDDDDDTPIVIDAAAPTIDASAVDAFVPPGPDAAPPPPCDLGWIEGAGRCYRVNLDATTWELAEKGCEELGAGLVIIQDDAENQLVRGLSEDGPEWWIGASDLLEEDDFRWIDGSLLNFSDWGTFQPDDLFFSEDCVSQVDDGRWYDSDCENDLPYVCERDPH